MFLVIAAAAPLGAMVGTVPLAFAIGDGAGFPAMFVLAGLTLGCFSVGYAAMSRRIVNAGGFYAYLSAGLGKPVAVAGGLVATVAYSAVAVGMAGAFGYFAGLVGQGLGLDLPWPVWSAIGIGGVALLGYRQVDLSAKVLSVLMIGEIGVLLVLDIGILADRGADALPAASFDPGVVFGSGVGVSLMFAFISYIGFESAALYGEETRDPRRSVPLATYLSVAVITVFYAFTAWTAVGAVGPDQVRDVAGKELGNLFFGLSTAHVGEALTVTMQVMLCTSMFAAMVALHNAANRYVFALGRERVLPHGLGRVHPRHGSPSRASLVQTVIAVVVVGAFAVAGLDPYLNLATSMLALGTLGIIVLQAGTAVATIAFFRGRPDRHWWRTGVAPLLGAVGLGAATVLLVDNFAILTGTDAVAVTALPWLLVLTAAFGLVFALWVRRSRPDRYQEVAAVEVRELTSV
ncbi:amino acid permease [Actinokineospora sp. NBRC 105648]|nr:amino acid permease [Actinokineospora sp. NBRC 105648]